MKGAKARIANIARIALIVLCGNYVIISMWKVCGNKDFFSVVMPSEDTKILEYNHHRKPNKIPSIIYANLESLIK